jgi:hypothetical protein
MRLFKHLGFMLGSAGVCRHHDAVHVRCHQDRVALLHGDPAIVPRDGKPASSPERSIPVEGPVAIPNLGAPENPVEADEASLARGAQLYSIHCQMCHGPAQGNGPIAPFLVNYKPAEPDIRGRAIQERRFVLSCDLEWH